MGGLIEKPVGENTRIEDRELNTDYHYYQSKLCCETCIYVDMAKLFRGPCCGNVSRPHFSLSGHDAERDGKCPSHGQMDKETLGKLKTIFAEVYNYHG